MFLFYACSKVFHVRPVTQGDVIRADAKEIPRIFQLLYAGEGEARRPDDVSSQQDISTLKGASDERISITSFKGKWSPVVIKLHFFPETLWESNQSSSFI